MKSIQRPVMSDRFNSGMTNIVTSKDKIESDILTKYFVLRVNDSGSDISNWDASVENIRKVYPGLSIITIESVLEKHDIKNPYKKN